MSPEESLSGEKMDTKGVQELFVNFFVKYVISSKKIMDWTIQWALIV